MESTTTAEVKIFFKDKQNELKGPYTEREVQDWYRQNWFDSSFPFYFMKGDEQPTEQTEFLTLETLRTLNGVVCPFAQIKSESNNEKNEEKLARIAKELSDLSKKCDGVKNLEKRFEDVEKRLKELATQPLEDVEKRLKELSTQPPPASSSSAATAAPVAVKPAVAVTAAKKPEKQPEENSEHARVANAWAAYYLDVLKAYETNKWEKVGKKTDENMLAIFPVLDSDSEEDSEPLRQKCEEVLLKKLMELDYVYCSECDAIFHDVRQILMHTMAEQHNKDSDALQLLRKAVNHVMFAIFAPLFDSLTKSAEEAIKHKEPLPRYADVDPSTPGLRPLLSFVDHIKHTYGDAICDYAGNLNSNRAQIVPKILSRLKQNRQIGLKIMGELHEHIGDRQTRCYECNVATGTREEYYTHLWLLSHQTKSDAFDLITLVVNLFHQN